MMDVVLVVVTASFFAVTACAVLLFDKLKENTR